MSDSACLIKLAMPGDLDSYIDLLTEIAEWLENRGTGHVPAAVYREYSGYYATSIANGEVHFAVIAGNVAGSFRLVENDGVVWPGASDDALYLENLVVRRGWNGRGVGREMLTWAEQKTKSAGRTHLRLDCFADNPILRKYYENAGYWRCGEVDAAFPFGTLRLQRYQKLL